LKQTFRSGWGLASSARTNFAPIQEFDVSNRGNSGLPVGLGRSYGDSALNSDGNSWSVFAINEIVIDPNTKVAQVGAGATIGELERAALPLGLFPPVVPGTEFVTIGGAIAADVHGKSHHKYGTFSKHVLEFDLMDATGTIHNLKPEGDTRERFLATAGGMGLTGIILSARIQLIPVETAYFKVEEKRASNFKELVSLINDFDRRYEYTVAWIDFSGRYSGRGIVSGGNHARLSELSGKKTISPLASKKPRNLTLPNIFPSFTINRFTVRAFNSLWYHKPATKGIVHSTKFLHPLDPIQKWNRIYGRRGFLQYQFVVPLNAVSFVSDVLFEMGKLKAASFVSVLKKFDGPEGAYLSFPKPGWTLAIDVPVGTTGLHEALSYLDKQVIALGGKIYLAKDSRLSAENFRNMFPEYSKWLDVKRALDPNNYWQSDQGRRLGLC
jgi:decaprenylphospho-beta-D-ribofuranose 2-oxidase